MSLEDADPLAAAMARVSETFGGMTARASETGCGRCFSEDELELLRSPDIPLPADLVRRVAQKEPGHWDDQPAVIRRVLPQLVVMLAQGADEPDLLVRGLAAAGWPKWPGEQAGSVAGLLDAWWTHTLRNATPPTSAPDVFASCVTASSTVTPWLARWAAETTPIARQHLNECVNWWRQDLESDTSPFTWWWGSAAEEQAAWEELKAWPAGRDVT
ncbi:hypothetical protein [Actinacidiphila acididurans]|uniref:Uncharacterized protein n=1 Tax=Actinacidiphila acididurans TaxID=2784346 RepID=A0ABS2U284_9ACTN|nr:hypothetical protein [Actinacidiphila acididurans]MBM9509311.1 hypothetical protein [Actinacidiphila acididurans]